MPARNLPTPQDAAAARRSCLTGWPVIARYPSWRGELAPLHPRNNTFPGEVFLDVAADVLDWCSLSRSEPLALEGMRERFLPELAFCGTQNKKLKYSMLAAAALRAERNRTRSTRSPAGKPTTSDSTPCTRRSPISAPQLAESACRCAARAHRSLAIYLARTSTNRPAAQEPSIRGLIGC